MNNQSKTKKQCEQKGATMKNTKSTVVRIFVWIMIACGGLALRGSSVIYSEDTVSCKTIQEALSEKFDATLQDENLVVVTDSNIHLMIECQSNRKLIRIWAQFKGIKEMSHIQKLIFCENFNDDTIFVRLCLTPKDGFYLDYFLPYDGGITSDSINKTIGLFLDISEHFRNKIIEDIKIIKKYDIKDNNEKQDETKFIEKRQNEKRPSDDKQKEEIIDVKDKQIYKIIA